MIDLHVHTIASDGQYSAGEIIRMAKEQNITTLAITDHDSCASVEEAITEGKNNNVAIIPGIEITAFDDREIHILGYNLDYKSERMLEYEGYAKKKTEEEDNLIFKVLNDKGINITRKSVEQYIVNEEFSTKHVAQWLVDNGYEKNKDEAWNKYFLYGELKNRKSTRMSVKDAIELISDLGGISVWAHPCRFGVNDYDDIKNKLEKYISYGLKGVEVFYSMHSDEQVEFLKQYVENEGMFFTLGSDYHGPDVKNYIELGKGMDNSLVKYQTSKNQEKMLKQFDK